MTEPHLGYVLALIPARGGSTRLPRKNLAEVGGLSLLGRSVAVARAVARIAEVLVSSDAEEILDEAVRHGAAVDRRAPELATSNASSRAVIDDLLARRPDVDALVLLQPTSPLRAAVDIEACLDALAVHLTATTVCAVDHPTSWAMHLAEDGSLEPVAKEWERVGKAGRSELRLNGAVYAARAEHLRSGGPLVGPGTAGIVMPRERSIDVDEPFDLHLARLLATTPFKPVDR